MKNLHGTDQRTMAFINLYAVLGTLEELCALDSRAREILGEKRMAVGFQVAGGPCATLTFDRGACTLSEGADHCDIKLPFSTPEKFNGMIDGTVTPFPSKGLTKVRFLTKEFIALTDLLTKYLRAAEEDLKISRFAQGMTFLGDILFLSYSTGIMPSRLAAYPVSDGIRDFTNQMALENIHLPYMLEQICMDGGTMYLLFESGSHAYRYLPGIAVDRVLKIDIL